MGIPPTPEGQPAPARWRLYFDSSLLLVPRGMTAPMDRTLQVTPRALLHGPGVQQCSGLKLCVQHDPFLPLNLSRSVSLSVQWTQPEKALRRSLKLKEHTAQHPHGLHPVCKQTGPFALPEAPRPPSQGVRSSGRTKADGRKLMGSKAGRRWCSSGAVTGGHAPRAGLAVPGR